MLMKTMLIAFSGKGEQIGHAEGFVSSAADGIVVKFDLAGVSQDGQLSNSCGKARFETVVMARNGRTVEAGRVFFPEIDSYLDVFTPETGIVLPADEGKEIGSITWHIKEGGGEFEGATGVVTGNFIGYPDGAFVDHQVYRVLLP